MVVIELAVASTNSIGSLESSQARLDGDGDLGEYGEDEGSHGGDAGSDGEFDLSQRVLVDLAPGPLEDSEHVAHFLEAFGADLLPLVLGGEFGGGAGGDGSFGLEVGGDLALGVEHAAEGEEYGGDAPGNPACQE